jgi:ribose transport system permease protein
MLLRMKTRGTRPAASVPPGMAPAALKPQGFLRVLLTRYATVLILLVLMVAFSFLSQQFLTSLNLKNLLVVQVTVCCMAFAAILPLIVGEFDLSLGYSLGFLMMLGALLGGQGFGAAVVIAAMLIGGALVGVLNGFLRIQFQISSFIATLGVGILLSGATQGMSGGSVLYAGIPPQVTAMGQSDFLGLGITVWLTLVLAIALVFVLEHTPFGRQLYAIGGSERVAYLAGIRVDLYRVLAFAGAGLLVGVASVFELGQSGGANPLFGPELLLPAYAASFLGVTTYRPGYFNVPGALVAIILLAVGFNGLNLLGAPYWLQPIFNGVVLILAVITAKAEGRQILK